MIKKTFFLTLSLFLVTNIVNASETKISNEQLLAQGPQDIEIFEQIQPKAFMNLIQKLDAEALKALVSFISQMKNEGKSTEEIQKIVMNLAGDKNNSSWHISEEVLYLIINATVSAVIIMGIYFYLLNRDMA